MDPESASFSKPVERSELIEESLNSMKMKEYSLSLKPRALMNFTIQKKVAILAVQDGSEPVIYKTVIVNSVAFQTARAALKRLVNFAAVITPRAPQLKAGTVVLIEAKSANFAIANFSSKKWYKVLAI